MSTDGLVPITREFLKKFYEEYPLDPAPAALDAVIEKLRSAAKDILALGGDAAQAVYDANVMEPPRKIDENLWRNRQELECVMELLSATDGLTAGTEVTEAYKESKEVCSEACKTVLAFQDSNKARIEEIFNQVRQGNPAPTRAPSLVPLPAPLRGPDRDTSPLPPPGKMLRFRFSPTVYPT